MKYKKGVNIIYDHYSNHIDKEHAVENKFENVALVFQDSTCLFFFTKFSKKNYAKPFVVKDEGNYFYQICAKTHE